MDGNWQRLFTLAVLPWHSLTFRMSNVNILPWQSLIMHQIIDAPILANISCIAFIISALNWLY